MPAAHRAVDHRMIRRRDIPYLTAYAAGAILVLFGAWLIGKILYVPFPTCVLMAAVCYGAILVGRWVKGILLGFLTATEHEGRVEAEETIHRETTVDMEWTQPHMRPVPAPAWPDTEPDPISDRGAARHDALAEHPRALYPDLRRAAGGARSAPA